LFFHVGGNHDIADIAEYSAKFEAIGAEALFEERLIENLMTAFSNVVEPHHFYADPAPGKNFNAAPAPADPAPAPTLLYSKANF
jgi:hypothetical protein